LQTLRKHKVISRKLKMKVRQVRVSNFRGIKALKWNVPTENIVCLIGKGDSSKTTILDAIQFAFHPHWNLSLSDSDFYQGNIENDIIIEVTIGNLPDEFFQITKYGQHLRGWNSETLTLEDEPRDEIENVLTVSLKVCSDLEPKWRVINARTPEGVEFRTSDRQKVSVSMIGAYTSRQLSWANGSPLTNLTSDTNLNGSLIQASRSARQSLDTNRSSLKCFDNAAALTHEVALSLGITTSGAYKAHLDSNSINIHTGGLALHDGDVPVKQLGLGSRRMLLCGIQAKCLLPNHTTLIDEIESGLEPHRITRLLKHLSKDLSGQYFITTHSSTVLKELKCSNLNVVHNDVGVLQVKNASNQTLDELGIQGKIRNLSEAFLARKVIICEGATEVGFLRGFDDYKLDNGFEPMSYHGVQLVDAGGAKNIVSIANAFKALNYQVAVFADSDSPDNFSEQDEARLNKSGIKVVTWAENLAIEQRVIRDISWKYVLLSLDFARDKLNLDVWSHVTNAYQGSIPKEHSEWVDNEKFRIAIGLAAKKRSWYKNIANGEEWCAVVSPCFGEPEFNTSDLVKKLNEVWEFVVYAPVST
jgi:putative ATP-dependent endonuclease of the OLD family